MFVSFVDCVSKVRFVSVHYFLYLPRFPLFDKAFGLKAVNIEAVCQ